MLEQYMLTTIDNPYNPFKDFRSWYNFDLEKGYKCCEIVDRLTNITKEYSEKEKIMAVNAAIDRFIAADPFNIYARVAVKTHYVV